MKCKVCGKEFELKSNEHYIARDNEIIRTGIVGIVGTNTDEEPTMYDAFDCPHCGCQNVMQERKRALIENTLDKGTDESNNNGEDTDTQCDEDCDVCLLEDTCERAKEKHKKDDKPSCFGSFNKCEYPYCSKIHECKENSEPKDVAYPNCIGNCNKYAKACKECEYIDECVARSEANEVRNN